MRITLRECQELPKGYGIAWSDPFWPRAVAYRIPFNLIARWWHGLSLWVRYGGRPQRVEYDLTEAYERGRRDGLAAVQNLEEVVVFCQRVLKGIDERSQQPRSKET